MTSEVRRRQFYPKTDLAFDPALLPVVRARKERDAPALVGLVAAWSAESLAEEVAHCRLLPGAGTFHAIYEIETRAGGRWIVRVAMAPELGPALHLAADQILFRQLGRVGVPTSPVLIADLTRRLLPHDCQILRRAPGVKATLLENPESQAMDPALLRAIGATMARVHQIHGRGFGLVDWAEHLRTTEPTGRHPEWAGYLRQNLEEHLDVCVQIGAISQAERGEINALLNAVAPLWAAAPSRLLHGDPGHHNFYAEEGSVTALLDWEDALCGDPVFDLAHWGTFTRESMRAPMLEGYATVADTPADFEPRYWGCYLRIALSKTVHRHLFGIPERPGRPPASRRIQLAMERLRGLD